MPLAPVFITSFFLSPSASLGIWGGLDFIDSHHMELTGITDVFTHHWNYALTADNPDTCYRAVTGLHIHPLLITPSAGDIHRRSCSVSAHITTIGISNASMVAR
jgi:hypothetical protein